MSEYAGQAVILASCRYFIIDYSHFSAGIASSVLKDPYRHAPTLWDLRLSHTASVMGITTSEPRMAIFSAEVVFTAMVLMATAGNSLTLATGF